MLPFYSYFITDYMIRNYNNKVFKIIIKTKENLNRSTVKLMHPSNPLFIPLDVYTAGSLDFISLDVYGSYNKFYILNKQFISNH